MRLQKKTVLETYIQESSKLIHLIINGEKIVTTETHPFYVNNHGFVDAGELEVGDELIDFRGNILFVENIVSELTQEPTTVYNFQVEDFHTYYVGKHCIFVHNADCGGRYADLKKTSDSSKEQVHHIPADSASPLSKSDGVAIKMDISDHKKTASFDNKPGSRAYRKTQARLISEGKFQEAFNMDVADIKAKFPGKYDDFIKQAQSYLNELIKGGKVK